MISIESTEGVNKRERLPFWNSLVSDTFTSLDVSPKNRQEFNASIKKARLCDIGVAEVFSPAASVAHKREQISHETEAFFLVHLQLQGKSINRQGGREAMLAAGDFTICDTTRPYSVEFDEDNTMLVMRLPEVRLNSVIAAPEDITCIPVRCHGVSGRFTSSILTQVWQHVENSHDDSLQKQLLERMVMDSLAIGLKDFVCNKVSKSAFLRSKRIRIVSFVEANLRQPELSPTYVAKAFNISTRYLHQIFSTQGESLSQYILRRRLESAAELLPRTHVGGQTISEVAFGLGFNSLTHFGRVFRERYGMPPKEYLMRHPLPG